MYSIRIAGAGKPVACSAESKRVDHSIFIASAHFLQHISSDSIEYADIDAFFAGSSHFVPVERDGDGVQN